jgi:hypothetical protein
MKIVQTALQRLHYESWAVSEQANHTIVSYNAGAVKINNAGAVKIHIATKSPHSAF